MDNWTPIPEFEEDIRRSFQIPAIRKEFRHHLYTILSQQAIQKRKKSRRLLGLHPAWAVVLACVIIMIFAALIIGPQKVYARFLKMIGYYPGAGFVDLKQVWVLENGVTQVHNEQKLTVARGISDAYRTDLWLEFNDEARPVDGAWLEAEEGMRFELLNWNYTPDRPGSRGVEMHFTPLPASIKQVTLILPEGWRIPLTWVPGDSGAIYPIGIVTTPVISSQPATVSTKTDMSEEEGSPCAVAMDIEFCVRAAVRAEGELQVFLEAISENSTIPGSDYSLSMFDVPGEMSQLILKDSGGTVYQVNENFIQPGGDPTGRTTTLHFPAAGHVAGQLRLQIPTVLVSVPLSEEMSIDLGSQPEPGQKIDIDDTIDVAGMPVHFGKAELIGSRHNDSLMLVVSSDPIAEYGNLRPYSIAPGRPEGIEDRYGAGTGSGSIYIRIELMQPRGVFTGVLHIPLVSASILVEGPFTLSFNAPSEMMSMTPQAEVITNGCFTPLPVGEPLPMDSYKYAGRGLRSGEFLFVVWGEGQSTLYATSPDTKFAAEMVAVLPGQVLAVFPHADHHGIDYLTGENDTPSADYVYHQLYTLRFDDPFPRLLVGQFEHSAFDAHWSFDGRFLAYTINNEKPGQTERRFVRLIDLNCRYAQPCSAFTANTDGQDFYGIEWSPAEYRLAIGGQQKDQMTGVADVFMLSVDPATNSTNLTNLTQSPEIEDMVPAQWAADGKLLYYPCSLPDSVVNTYSLCRNDLKEGMDEVSVPNLPWNMHALKLAGDHWLVDRVPVVVNGIFKIRIFDMVDGKEKTLAEWTSDGKDWNETIVSPNGKWLTTIIDHFGGLIAINTETLSKTLILSTSENLHLLTWVK